MPTVRTDRYRVTHPCQGGFSVIYLAWNQCVGLSHVTARQDRALLSRCCLGKTAIKRDLRRTAEIAHLGKLLEFNWNCTRDSENPHLALFVFRFLFKIKSNCYLLFALGGLLTPGGLSQMTIHWESITGVNKLVYCTNCTVEERW